VLTVHVAEPVALPPDIPAIDPDMTTSVGEVIVISEVTVCVTFTESETALTAIGSKYEYPDKITKVARIITKKPLMFFSPLMICYIILLNIIAKYSIIFQKTKVS
jgi:hypothetical protein